MAVMGAVHNGDDKHEVFVSVYGGGLNPHGVAYVELRSTAGVHAAFSVPSVSELKFLIEDLQHALKQAKGVRAGPRQVEADERVRAALAGVQTTTMADVCQIMGWPADTAGMMKTGGVLRSLGFVKHRQRTDGVLHRVWVRE